MNPDVLLNRIRLEQRGLIDIHKKLYEMEHAVSDILQAAYEDTLAEIDSERASLTYSDIDDSVGGHVSYNICVIIDGVYVNPKGYLH